jgi:hypothetical protein
MNRLTLERRPMSKISTLKASCYLAAACCCLAVSLGLTFDIVRISYASSLEIKCYWYGFK